MVNVTSSLAWLVTSENPLMRGRKATDKFELHELNESAEEYIVTLPAAAAYVAMVADGGRKPRRWDSTRKTSTFDK